MIARSLAVAATLCLASGADADRAKEVIELVFKDGLGYFPKKLLDSVRGHVGQ